MKKENFVIGLVVVGAVAFFLGRLSVSRAPEQAKQGEATAEKTPKAGQQPVAKGTPAATPAEPVKGTAEPKAAAGAKAPKHAVGAGAKQPARPAASNKPAVVARADRNPRHKRAGSALAIPATVKGPEHAKVTIMEISDFQ